MSAKVRKMWSLEISTASRSLMPKASIHSQNLTIRIRVHHLLCLVGCKEAPQTSSLQTCRTRSRKEIQSHSLSRERWWCSDLHLLKMCTNQHWASRESVEKQVKTTKTMWLFPCMHKTWNFKMWLLPPRIRGLALARSQTGLTRSSYLQTKALTIVAATRSEARHPSQAQRASTALRHLSWLLHLAMMSRSKRLLSSRNRHRQP